MKNFHTLAIFTAAAFAACLPAHAAPDMDALCETNQFDSGRDGSQSELPYSAFRLVILPDMGRSPGNFIATITKHATATIELTRPTRTCRWELTVDDCPAIADVAAAFEQLNIPIGKDHAAPLEWITLHATTYRLEVRGTQGQRHSISYHSELDNPIAEFMHDARGRLLACVPQLLQDPVDPSTDP